MIKKALEYIVGMVAPNIEEIDGQTYSDKPLHRIHHDPVADSIEMSTLSSLVEYITEKVDEMPTRRMIVHVVSPTRVSLYSALNYERDREYLVRVNAVLPDFEFGRFMEHEAFCIGLQSKFINSADRALLLKFAGTVEAGSVSEYGDDGITQKATVKTGIASKGDAIVPSPANLRPFRTFLEVEQPESSFIFRMKQDSRGEIMCALFEADGGAWRMEAMKNIKAYLADALKDLEQFVVIS